AVNEAHLSIGVPADLTVPAEVGFVHRTLPYAEIYFLVNTSNHPVQGEWKARLQGLESTWWDPFTGKSSHAGSALMLAPYESRVLVFSKERARASPPVIANSHTTTLDLNGAWKLTFPNRETRTIERFEPWPDQFYSGTATYENTLKVAEAVLKTG